MRWRDREGGTNVDGDPTKARSRMPRNRENEEAREGKEDKTHRD
jgi:hypothetical protein